MGCSDISFDLNLFSVDSSMWPIFRVSMHDFPILSFDLWTAHIEVWWSRLSYIFGDPPVGDKGCNVQSKIDFWLSWPRFLLHSDVDIGVSWEILKMSELSSSRDKDSMLTTSIYLYIYDAFLPFLLWCNFLPFTIVGVRGEGIIHAIVLVDRMKMPTRNRGPHDKLCAWFEGMLYFSATVVVCRH